MKVPLQVQRSTVISVPHARALSLLDDLEGTLRLFPKLRRLVPLSENRYRWEMDTIGSRPARIAHNVSYGADYQIDREAGRLSWAALPAEGNATITGYLQLEEVADGTRLCFRVEGELRDVPVPLMYRLLAPPFIQGKFSNLIDRYLQALEQHLRG